MEDDRTLRVVILPNAPSTGPLIDLLRALVVQRLIDPPILLVDNTLRARRLGVTSDTDEVKPLRTHIETAHCQRFLLINLVTADAIVSIPEGESPRIPSSDFFVSGGDAWSSDLYMPDLDSAVDTDRTSESSPVVPELRTAFEVDMFIRNALAFKSEARSGETAQRLDVINLVVPAAQARSLPTYLHSQGPRVAANVSGWSNVAVAPEIQSTSLQAVVPVMDDQEYVAHVGGALITVAGCWAGASWDPDFPSWQPDLWTVVRCRSRSIVAPELPIRVLSRIGGSANRVPVSDDIEYSIAPTQITLSNWLSTSSSGDTS